jgi:cyclophilin family peptidyl-prolyl cis-trans isomerase
MRHSSDATSRSSKTYSSAGDFLQHLESRQMLTLTSPLPAVTLMEDQSNPVARIVTNFGDIDLELYQNTNPGTVTNFEKYISDGDYDQFFFHRLVRNFVLQGGGFRYDDHDGLTPVPTDPPINNEFHRSNIARTVAMAKLGSNPDSATSQFFVNLVDNHSNLDGQNGGFTVFGKVLGDVSWSVVQGIANLPIVDLRNDPKFTGQFSGNFQNVPVSNAFQPVPGGPGPTEATLVLVWDIELIKPAGTTQFYDESVQYPEGFAGSTINEFLPIGNPNNETVFYQVIARAETPQGTPSTGYTWFRDRVIASGQVAPNARGGITISHFGEGGAPSEDDLVPQGVPYGIEVRSTKPLAVNLSHYDFGTSTGENFVSTLNEDWTFADSTKLHASVNQFLVWYNPDAVPVNVSITFIRDDGTIAASTSVQTDRYRRGGLNIDELGSLADNSSYSIKVSADRNIVAALTGYDSRGDKTGFTELGIDGPGSTRGVIPMGQAGAHAQQFISLLNASDSTAAVVTLVLSFSDGSAEVPITTGQLIMAAGTRTVFDLSTIPEANDGRRYTIRYTSGSTPMYAHARNVQFGDEVRYPAALSAATRWSYAEGFMDPSRAGTDVLETLSFFNPNTEAMGRTNADAHVTVRFLYTDGTVVTENRTVASAGRVDLDIHDLDSILGQGRQNSRFYYSIDVSSDVPITSQFWHHDLTLGGLQPSGGFGELGAPGGTIVRLG